MRLAGYFHHYGLALGPLTNVPIKRRSSCFSGPLPAPIRNAPISISATWPPEGRLGSCLTNTPSVSIDGERPPITVGAVVNRSRPNDHANCSVRPLLKLY